MSDNFYLNPCRALTICGNTSASAATLALNSAYVYATSGTAVAFKFIAPATTTLTKFYFFASAVGGTGQGAVVELRQYGAAGTPATPSTLVTNGSGTVSNVTTAPKWYQCTWSTPPNVTAGETYYVVIGAASTDAVNNFTVKRAAACGLAETALNWIADNISTSNGFSTAGTDNTSAACFVAVFGNGMAMGNPYTLSAVSIATNNSLERGLVWNGGPTEQLSIAGVFSIWNRFTGYSGFRIYTGSAVPGGTTLLDVTFSTSQLDAGVALFPPVTLPKATTARFVFKNSSSNQSPTAFQVEDSATYGADLLLATAAGGVFGYCQDNGAGGWTDKYDYLPRMGLIVNDLVAAAGGGTVIVIDD